MPRWFRVPKGTYTRDTPDWFARQRGRGVVQFNPSRCAGFPFTPSIGLVNANTANVYLHVIGFTAWCDGDPAGPPPEVFPPNPDAGNSLFGRYSSGSPVPIADTNNAIWGPCSPLYSDAPNPPGSTVAGGAVNPTFLDNQVLTPTSFGNNFANDTGETLYWPPWDLAVIAPNTTWELYSALAFTGLFYFEYYWLNE
jgi:hypothetical protein